MAGQATKISALIGVKFLKEKIMTLIASLLLFANVAAAQPVTVDGVGIMHLTNRDVVRNKIVKDIVKAFEKHEAERAALEQARREARTEHRGEKRKI
mgnify:CR=1 FL=1